MVATSNRRPERLYEKVRVVLCLVACTGLPRRGQCHRQFLAHDSAVPIWVIRRCQTGNQPSSRISVVYL